MSIKEFIIEELRKNTSRQEMYFKAKRNLDYNKDYKTFSDYVTKVKRRNVLKKNNDVLKNEKNKLNHLDSNEELILDQLKPKKFIDVKSLAKSLSLNKNEIMALIENLRKKGFEVIYTDDKISLSDHEVVSGNITQPLEDKEIIFGVASDLHFGSKACQLTALNEFCHICKKNDVKYIFSPGDIVAGNNIYPGQLYDIYAMSADKQEQSVIKNLPKGFEWIMIGGNHDYGFIKKGGGHNPLLVIENYRDDVKYVGFDEANVPILNNVDLKMWHPSGGAPYSISYRLQKGIEQIAFDELKSVCDGSKEKPTLRFVLAGHLHIQMQAMFGSIFGMQCGTFEGTTNYLKRKGLSPSIGGWIVKATLGPDTLLKNFEAKFHMFKEIENDWKNYDHEIPVQPRITSPIFEG